METETESEVDVFEVLERAARESLRARVVEAILEQQLVYAHEPNWTQQTADTRAEVMRVLDRLLDRVTTLGLE